MKRGTTEHPKFLALCLRLNLDSWEGQGLLEAIWHFTARFARRGDIGRWTDEQIARGIGWKRSPGSEMVAALVAERWLDEHTEHRLIVHDWNQHADDTIHRQLARARELFANGVTPQVSRLPLSEKAEAKRELARLARVRTKCAPGAAQVRPSLPFPTPPEPEPGEKINAARAARSIATWFEEVFVTAYPKHRQATQITSARNYVTRQLRPDESARARVIEHLEAWKSSSEWTKDGGEYVPGLRKFFEKRCHEILPVERPRDEKPTMNGVKKLQLASGGVIEIKPGTRIEFTDTPGAIDGFVMPNGKLSVRSGAKWI